MILALFAYAFASNIALALVPHEPIVIWYGPRLGVAVRLPTGLLAALFVLLLIPSVRVLIWQRQPAN